MSLIKTVIDWESAFGISPSGRKVTLSAMTTEEYIRDREFKVFGLGVKIDADAPFYIYKADDLLYFLKTHQWGKSFVIAHHSHFDLSVLSWRCGIRPAFIGDTMSMARAIYPYEAMSLNNISKVLGLGEKGVELQTVRDKWVLTDQEQRVLGGYCVNDVALTARIFDALKGYFPVPELRLIDWTVRRFSEPAFIVDRKPLIEAYKKERRTKRELLKACNTDKKILASNDQFAGLLLSMGVDPPKKVSPSKFKDGRVDPDEVGDPPMGLLPSFKKTKGMTVEEAAALKEAKRVYPWAYAFGKSDERFKMLTEHPDPQVQAIVDARMGIKSTIKETRSKRFFKIGTRGRFPVYLNYYGAHTNRWSGGDKQNAQNLNRVDYKDPTAGALRMSLCAPKGHVVVVRDLGQIEARKLAYWAGQEDMLEVFRTGGDPYNFMASRIYGFEVDRKNNPEHKNAGMVGKIVVLGCLGGDTIVYTNHGQKKLVDVRTTDMVWDGIAFVNHKGVIPQGVKECLIHSGVAMTPDHEVKTENSWQEWQSVLTNPSLFQSALSLGSLPSWSGETRKVRAMTPSFGALAGTSSWHTGPMSLAARLHDAISVLKKQVGALLKNTMGMPRLFPMIITESGSSTAYPPASKDAITRKTICTTTTGRGESGCTSLGEGTERSSLSILSRYLDGIFRVLSWIESIIIGGTPQGTFGSAPERRTYKTGGLSKICRRKMMTYDIAFSGPRSCFAVKTDCGPIIVHNCGYQMGAWKLQEGVRVGFMGMPGFLFDQTYVNQLGVDVEGFKYQRSYRPGCSSAAEQAELCRPLNVSPEDHLIHCAVTKHLVDVFRMSNYKVVALWNSLRNALPHMLAGSSTVIGENNLIAATGEGLELPNGMLIRYHGLRQSTGNEREYKYLSNRKKKEWTKIYGGKMAENGTQALSRLVISDQLLSLIPYLKSYSLRKGEVAEVVSSTHDELIAIVPERYADDCLSTMRTVMATAPPWCKDLPLKSSGGYAVSYGDCEK